MSRINPYKRLQTEAWRFIFDRCVHRHGKPWRTLSGLDKVAEHVKVLEAVDKELVLRVVNNELQAHIVDKRPSITDVPINLRS